MKKKRETVRERKTKRDRKRKKRDKHYLTVKICKLLTKKFYNIGPRPQSIISDDKMGSNIQGQCRSSLYHIS